MSLTPLHINTPIIYSQHLNNEIQKNVFFKLDALQPSGSFKIRGIGRLCQQYVEQGIQQFVASSGGNAGIAVAYSGMKLRIPTTVFIPTTSNPIYIREIEDYGAKVIVAGNVWDEAHQAALAYANEHQAGYVPPFDHPTIWNGHATLMQEVKDSGIKPEAIILAVGGGGLACGILEGLHKLGWAQIPLIAVETKGADSFYQSVKAKKLITLDAITSKATSLGAKRITPRLLKWSHNHDIINVVVTDEEAEFGAREFAKDKRILVELSAGAALSIVYNNHSSIQPYHSVLVIVCGGVNTVFFNL